MSYSKEYIEFVDDLLKKYNKMISREEDYMDYCNLIREKDPDTRYTFWPASERVFIDMDLDHVWDDKNLQKNIKIRKENAKEWLIKNLKTYDEFKNLKHLNIT